MYADDQPIVYNRGAHGHCVMCMVDCAARKESFEAAPAAVGDAGGWSLCEPHLAAFGTLNLAVANNAARVSTLHSVVARLWYAPPYDSEGDRCPGFAEYRTLREGARWPIPPAEMFALGVSVETAGGRACCGSRPPSPHADSCRR